VCYVTLAVLFPYNAVCKYGCRLWLLIGVPYSTSVPVFCLSILRGQHGNDVYYECEMREKELEYTVKAGTGNPRKKLQSA
jgi:hypothetical protein